MSLPTPQSSRPEFGGIALGALAILLFSTAAGLVFNHLSPHPLPVLVKVEGQELPLPPGLIPLTLSDAKRLYDAKELPFIDARQPDAYQAGHIPGAINLPADDYENRFLDVADTLLEAPALLVYCTSSDCGEALATIERLRESYQGEIRLFIGGWFEWSAAQYPTTTGESP